MCGIAGFYSRSHVFTNNKDHYENILKDINCCQLRRGPDDNNYYLNSHFALAHTRLSIIDPFYGQQPMLFSKDNSRYGISYNGEIYNMNSIKSELNKCGVEFQTNSDTEVILRAFIYYGPDFVNMLNGIFAFAIMDTKEDKLFLYRDPLGIKPMFYTCKDDCVIFASELKGIFKWPTITPTLSKQGLNEIFSLGPAKTYGCGVFDDIHEVYPGHYLSFEGLESTDETYWTLKAKEHIDDFPTTVDKVNKMVTGAIKNQMLSDVPICTFLSGGIDSSIVSSVCASELKKEGKILNTFSFEFTGNNEYFKSNSFQPSLDKPYVDIMVKHIGSNHRYLNCNNEDLADALYKSVIARDMPAMADVDSSMLYFCSKVKEYNKVVLTGECADEIFGGYPWFYRDDLFNATTFPWTKDLNPRKELLKDDFLDFLGMDEYINNAYSNTLKEVSYLDSDDSHTRRIREITYLNIKWFMQTLLDRMDRTSMFSGLEARVPFADVNILEYLYNVPWDMKYYGNMEKGLLRESARGIVPDEILFRKKSPYPKTYNPGYEKILKDRLRDIISNPNAPVLSFIDKNKLESFMAIEKDYGKPWYGQLMAGPQLLAYILMINYWIEYYNINIKI